MRRTFFFAALFSVFSASIFAAEKPVTTIPAVQRVVLVQGGSINLGSSAYSVPLTGVTGLFGWGPESHLDAGVESNLAGGYMAGVGATVGSTPGDPGSGYTLRVGGGWSGLSTSSSFSVNPVSRLGMAEATPDGGDMALSFRFVADRCGRGPSWHGRQCRRSDQWCQPIGSRRGPRAPLLISRRVTG